MTSSGFSTPRTPKSRPAREIAASDDGDSDSGFSEDSLQDLSTLLGGPRPQATPRHGADAPLTPQAKRAAHALHKSPLAIIPKHKFDIKALAKDARRDALLQASSRRAGEPLRDKTAPSTPSGFPQSQSTLSDLVKAERGKDAHKVLRAVQRADAGHLDLRYYFFQADFHTPGASKPPAEAMKGPWNLLTKGNERVREQNLVSGVPYNIVGNLGGIPDTIFLWILEEICVAKSTVTQTELCDLIAICPDQVSRLLTADVVKSMWTRIGAVTVSLDASKINISNSNPDTYKDRDWSHLKGVLRLLQTISKSLPVDSTKYTIKILLQMAMDKVVISNIDIETQFESTLRALVDTISPEQWDSFCFDTCKLFKSNFTSQCIRINALLCLPVSSYRAHNLRRRLAITFLFDDATLAKRPPEEVLSLQGVIDRLDLPDFQVGPATEFAELRAAILILDMAVDDGSVFTFADMASEDQFNERIDELAGRLSEIWRRTNDTGMKLARTEAKSVVEWVQKRILHTVRTRRKRAKSIFDVPGQDNQLRRDLPRQQEFMKSFFRATTPAARSRKKPLAPEPEPDSESEASVMDSIVVKGG